MITDKAGSGQDSPPCPCLERQKMNDKNNDINWEIVQEASHAAATSAIRRFRYNSLRTKDFHEVQHECIRFILADTPRSKKLARYATGEKTAEKVNKLTYSLVTDKSWLNDMFPAIPERYEADSIKVVRVDDSTAKEIVKRVFQGDTIDTESFALISDKLISTMSKSHRDILTAIYTNPSISKKQVAIDHGVGLRHVYKVITKAVNIAKWVWIPVFSIDNSYIEG